MFPLIDSELIHLRHQELLREAERAQVAASLPVQPGRWRARIGAGLIRLGAFLGGDKVAVPAHRAARPA